MILFPDGHIHRISKAVKSKTIFSNNSTEYLALIAALKYLYNSQMQDHAIQVYGDSQIVINQMNGIYKIGEGFYRPQALECQHLAKDFTDIKFTWIPREQNAEADALSYYPAKVEDANIY